MGDSFWTAFALNNLGAVRHDQGDDARERALFEEALAFWRRIGYRWSAAIPLGNPGDVARDRGICRAKHVTAILGKLGVASRTAAAARAVRDGMV